MDPEPAHHRTIVAGLVWNRHGQLLLCRMALDRGVFPGQWGLPGGGIEPGERMVEALRRELREEIGIDVEAIRPALFKDGEYEKQFADGSRRTIYMIFLVFHCVASSETLCLNEEFIDYRWLDAGDLQSLDLNVETADTLDRLGAWPTVD